ncbi:hypothetical protein MKW92_050742 [Papaver armeniacum]|nr:hypothetical protein MKW92_050742 [Papaver armeniacum]
MFKLMIKKCILPLAKKQDVYKHSVSVDNEKMKATDLPYDVKKGQFAVIAIEGDVANMFVVELDCLSNNPAILKLLPCKPDDLKRALGSSTSSRKNKFCF